jgi:hypothetical protein
MRFLLTLSIIAIFLLVIRCAGSFQSTVTSGYQPPAGEEIAVSFLDHPDINVSNKATAVLENELRECNLNNFISADETEDIFQKNNITIPRRLTTNFVKGLKEVLDAKYFLTSGVTIWKEGSAGFPIASSTEVGASLTMYDLDNGEVVWSISGEESGSSSILAEAPESKAEAVFESMLEEWEGFCRN